MFLNLCPETIGIYRQPFTVLLALAQTHGFGGLDVPNDVLQSAEQASAAGMAVTAAGLQWGLCWLPCDIMSGDARNYHAGMRTVRRWLPQVALTGCRRTYLHLWPGSDTQAYRANFRRHVNRLRPLVELLGEYGVTLGLEFIGPRTLRERFRFPFIHTLEATLELADACGPSTGMVLDFFHWYTSGGTLEELRRLLPIDRIVNVHANDAVAGRPRDEQLDLERAMPLATGVIDTAPLIAWLRENQYAGPLIAEPFDPSRQRFSTMPPDAVAREVGKSLRRLLGQ